MRTLNISIIIGMTAISALLLLFSLITGRSDFTISAASISFFAGLLLTSTAYIPIAFKNKSNKILSQAATLLLYLTSAIFGTLAGGNIGTIPWTMKSMSLNFMQAMDYIWPMLLICSAISISAFIFACFLVNTKKPNNLDPVGA